MGSLTLTDRAAYAIMAVAGAVGWIVIAHASGRREAWDAEAYFGLFLPLIATLVAWVAFLAPRRAGAVAFVQNPTAELLPLGLFVFAVFGLLCVVPALVGAAVRKWVAPPR
jgi:membrane protease YdiL (CAAX protease family)